MNTLLLSVVMGVVIGIMDVIPMILQKLPVYSTVSAFVHYFFVTIVIVHLDLPAIPWWLKGGVVALALVLPMLIQVGHTDKKPLPIITINAIVLGSVVGIASHFLVG